MILDISDCTFDPDFMTLCGTRLMPIGEHAIGGFFDMEHASASVAIIRRDSFADVNVHLCYTLPDVHECHDEFPHFQLCPTDFVTLDEGLTEPECLLDFQLVEKTGELILAYVAPCERDAIESLLAGVLDDLNQRGLACVMRYAFESEMRGVIHRELERRFAQKRAEREQASRGSEDTWFDEDEIDDIPFD